MTQTPQAENQARTSCRWLWWAVGATAALVALGVFLLPWFVPAAIRPITSDSQALGFNNRVALVSLALGCLAIVALAQLWRARCCGVSSVPEPVVLFEAANKDEGVSRVLLLVLSLAAVAAVAITATVYRSTPVTDSGYFYDRLLYLVNGSRPFVDFEFSYGPLLLYPPYCLWLVLRGIGVTLATSYYVVLAVAQVLGIGMTAYLLNHLRMTRAVRNGTLSIVVVTMLVNPSLSLNYTPLRFLTPFALMIAVLTLSERSVLLRVFAPAGAIVGAFALSPEMGLATVVALVVALLLGVDERSWPAWLGVVFAIGFGFLGWLLYSRLPGSAFVGFSAGAFYFPVLPGRPSLMYLTTVLIAAGGVSATSSWSSRSRSSPQLGWLATCLVLSIAALGRADIGHLFWNGLGATLLAVALLGVIARRWAWAYIAAFALSFLVAASSHYLVLGLPSMFQVGVKNGLISERTARGIAHRVGRKYSDGSAWWQKARIADPSNEQISRLIESGSVLAPFQLEGRLGLRLAESQSLVPLFASPDMGSGQVSGELIVSGLGRARYVLLREDRYQAFLRQVKRAGGVSAPAVWQTKVPVSPQTYGLLLDFPMTFRPAHPVYDSSLAFGQVLVRDWVVDRTSGDYVILRRR